MISLTVKDPAPDFTLLDQDGVRHTLRTYQGSWVLLYFYPKDDTPGCTKQACGIRDAFPDFTKLGIRVFGISPDSVARHKKFADKYTLPFTLLSDPEHLIAELYGAWGPKTFMGKSYDGVHRTSFLIDPAGSIAKIYERVKPEQHAAQVLADLRTMGV